MIDSIPNPHPARLLDDYLAGYAKRDPASLGNTIIRQRSLDGRHLVARHVLGDKGVLDDLIELGRHGACPDVDISAQDIDPARLATLARILTLQNILPGDLLDGLGLYDFIFREYGADKMPAAHQNLHAQITYDLRQFHRTRRLLDVYRKMHPSVRKALRLNLANPTNGISQGWGGWLEALQELMPPAYFRIDQSDGQAPFDRLSATPLAYCQDATRVSVTVTCFKPDHRLGTAVRSIAAQSWRNLEILLVDDGSPIEFESVLRRCAELDSRVRLIQLPQNNGTYAARNVALDMAQGEFLTFQDSDDWCHPHRIEYQLSLMLGNVGLVVTTANGLKISDDLTIKRVGRPVADISMPTMMLRIGEIRMRVGYFHEIRKAADGEYLRRVEAAFGESSLFHERNTCHKLIRQGAGSLSRNDFGVGGWMHPAREAYLSAYVYWHDQIEAGAASPYVPRQDNFTILPTAPHLLTNGEIRPRPRHYDYVFATDWRPYGAPAKAIIEEITAVKRTGASVGVLQLETLRYMSTTVRPLCGPIQGMINAGIVDRVIPTDPTTANLLIIRYPPVLQFVANQPIGLTPRQVIVLANQSPMELDGSDWRYVSTTCSANVETLFGVRPLWVPEGPATREALEKEGLLDPKDIAEIDLPCVLNLADWYLPRYRFRSNRPVLGRHSRDHRNKWPETRPVLLEVYTDDPSIDVRIMGGVRAALATLGTTRIPGNWTCFDYDELPVKAFLYQLDFWAYFHHPILVESFGRAILEAMAVGCVVILPERFRKTFGEGAVYCQSQEVRDVVEYYYADFGRYSKQVYRSVEYVRDHFSYDSYLRLLRRISDTPQGVGDSGIRNHEEVSSKNPSVG